MPMQGSPEWLCDRCERCFGLQLVFVDELMDERGHGRSGRVLSPLRVRPVSWRRTWQDAGQQVGAVCLAKRGLRTEKALVAIRIQCSRYRHEAQREAQSVDFRRVAL